MLGTGRQFVKNVDIENQLYVQMFEIVKIIY